MRVQRKLLPVIISLVSCCAAHAGKYSNGTATLSGTLKGGSGAIVALHLEPTADDPTRYYDGYEASLAEDGSFSFTEIPAGRYRLTVDAAVTTRMVDGRTRNQPSGFTPVFPSDMAGGTITLRGGEKRGGVTIELTHRLSICGHVTHDVTPVDSTGHRTGAPNLVSAETSITFYHFNPDFGILDNETRFDTDKDGSFHITDLAAGTYFVRSNNIWYPGSTSFSGAKPIVVVAATVNTCNTDIQLDSGNFGNSCNSGEVLAEIHSDPAVDKTLYQVTIFERNPLGVSARVQVGSMPVSKSSVIGAGDSFQTLMCAGSYEVVLSERDREGGNVWGAYPTLKVVFDTQPAIVTANEATKIALTPHPMARIDGEWILDRTTIQDLSSGAASPRMCILRDGSGEFQVAPISKAGHFDFYNVSPGSYQLFVTDTNPNKVLLKSIVANGAESRGRRFVISKAAYTSMAVAVTGDLTQVAGHVSPDVHHFKRWESEGMRPRASVAGKVVGDSGVFTVRLLPLGYNSNAPENLTTQTDRDGSFHFEGVLPGAYILRGHNKDLVRFDYGGNGAELRGTPLLISPGAKLMDLKLNAPKRSTICGRLTDSKGDPRPNMSINYRFPAGIRRPGSSSAEVDRDGYFRIEGLLPGDYSLKTWVRGNTVFVSRDGRLDEADPIHVESGKDVGCGANPPLDFRLPIGSEKYVALSGSVVGELPARFGDRFVVRLESEQDDRVGSFGPQAKLDAKGNFQIANVPIGHYRLNVYGESGSNPANGAGYIPRLGTAVSNGNSDQNEHLVASQPITVKGEDISDIKLIPIPIPAVTGTVHISHPADGSRNSQARILNLRLISRRRGSVSASLIDPGDEKSEFLLNAVDPGGYEIRVDFAGNFNRDNTYVQSARLNGEEVNPRLFNLPAADAASLQVELTNVAASVNVHLAHNLAFPMPLMPQNERCDTPGMDYGALLFSEPLIGHEVENEPEQFPIYVIGTKIGIACTEKLNGMIQSVAPGSYFAIAAKNADALLLRNPGTSLQGSPDVYQRKLWSELATIGKHFTVHSGETLELNLEDETIEAAQIAARVGVPDRPESLQPPKNQSCCSN